MRHASRQSLDDRDTLLNMDLITLDCIDNNELPTLPMQCESVDVQIVNRVFESGMVIDGVTLLSLMDSRINSELWYGEDATKGPCVIKLHSTEVDIDVLQRISEIECDCIVKVFRFGKYKNHWYEISPYYKHGALKPKMNMEVIKNIVMPCIIEALDVLHLNGIYHNDIKPSNIFWNNNRSGIVIGDFDSASCKSVCVHRLTPAYAAPELLLGNYCTKYSDWASVGLSLAYLFTGENLISAETKQEAERIWERGIRFENEDVDFCRLINGLINRDAKHRLGENAAGNWCREAQFGAEEYNPLHSKVIENVIPTLRYENPTVIVYDIKGLLDAFVRAWDSSVFFFENSQIKMFLRDVDYHMYEKCLIFENESDKEDAVFKLSIELSLNNFFVWRGEKYGNLLDLENVWDSCARGKRDVEAFIQRGHVQYVCERYKINTSEEKMRSIAEIQFLCKRKPDVACMRLFQQLHGEEGLYWEGSQLKSLDDLVRWLEGKEKDIDDAVNKLLNSSQFEAWLICQGLDGLIDEIRGKSSL